MMDMSEDLPPLQSVYFAEDDTIPDENYRELHQELHPPSEEQQAIIDSIDFKDKRLIIVDAVAGSGKTTTLLGVAKQHPQKRFIMVTYNSKLKTDVRQKCKFMQITNEEIHTYHSLAVKYYNRDAHEESVFIRVVMDDLPPFRRLDDIDGLFIDEAQDMNDMKFQFMNKFTRDMKLNCSMIILGDKYQCIYSCKGADSRYLTNASQLWTMFEPDQVRHLALRTSYRVTKPIAKFINFMTGEDRLISIKDGVTVKYIQDSLYDFYRCDRGHRHLPIILFLQGLKDGTILPEEVFVLAGTTKQSKSDQPTPFGAFANYLRKRLQIPIYYHMNDESDIIAGDMKGKIVFSNMHQVKGMERNYVIIFDFVESYFNHIARDQDNNVCPNTIYMACSRPMKELIVIQSSGNSSRSTSDGDPFKFLTLKGFPNNIGNDPEYLEISRYNWKESVNLGEKIQIPPKSEIPIPPISVSDLVKNVGTSARIYLGPIIENGFLIVNQAEPLVKMETRIFMANGMSETVAEINGLAIPFIIEMEQTGHILMWEQMDVNSLSDLDFREYITNIASNVKYPPDSLSDYTKLATVAYSRNLCLNYKLAQIPADRYDWLSEDCVNSCMIHLKFHLGGMSKYEVSKVCEMPSDYGNIVVRGRIDCKDENTVWELKCVHKLELEHLLQLIVYRWMDQFNGCRAQNYKILNMRSGEVQQLSMTDAQVDSVVRCLIKNKYEIPHVVDDDQFMSTQLESVERFRSQLVVPKIIMSDSSVVLRDYPQVENEFKYPSRYTKETFAEYEVLSTDQDFQSNYMKCKSGSIYKSGRNITIGGKIHNELRENFMIKYDHGHVIFFDEIKGLDFNSYLLETEKIHTEIDDKNLMIRTRNQMITDLIKKLDQLGSWEDKIEFEGRYYGVPKVHNNIHREKNCMGGIQEGQYESCGCHSCEDWGGCSAPSWTQHYRCAKCGYGYSEEGRHYKNHKGK
jgi:hypothetical protein